MLWLAWELSTETTQCNTETTLWQQEAARLAHAALKIPELGTFRTGKQTNLSRNSYDHIYFCIFICWKFKRTKCAQIIWAKRSMASTTPSPLTRGCRSSLPSASPPSGPRPWPWGPRSTRTRCPCWGRSHQPRGSCCQSSCGRPRPRSSRWTRSCRRETTAPPCGWSCPHQRSPPDWQHIKSNRLDRKPSAAMYGPSQPLSYPLPPHPFFFLQPTHLSLPPPPHTHTQ